MKRASRLYIVLLGSAITLSGISAWLSVGPSELGSTRALVRFVVFIATIAVAAATWASAVMIASVYRIVWPLVASTTSLVAGFVAIAAWWTSGR